MQKEMRDSGACMKAHCKQNLSPQISAIDIGHNDFLSFTRIRQVVLLVSRHWRCLRGWKHAFLRGIPLRCFDVQASLNIESRDLPLKSTFNAEIFISKLSWSIFSDFGAIHSWNVSCSPKSPKKSI